MVVTLSDPLGHSVRLPDLRPYTIYNLSLRENVTHDNATAKVKERVLASLNFSTAGKSIKCFMESTIYVLSTESMFSCICIFGREKKGSDMHQLAARGFRII